MASPWPSDPVATSTYGSVWGLGWPSRRLPSLRSDSSSASVIAPVATAQRARLNVYQVQARFALASIYDRAAARVEPEPADAAQAALAGAGQ